MARRKHRPRKGKSAKKAKAATANADEEFAKNPHSFIFNRNRVGRNVTRLIKDMRKVMEPYTATKLKARKKNQLKDFISVASIYNVTHLVMFTKTKLGVYMKIARVPHGPTISFKVESYSLAKDIVSSLKKPHSESKQFLHHPLLVMNNFGGEALNHKIISSMFQNLFPSIHINKARLNDYKRCVVLSYNSEEETIDFRHYNIHVVPTGLSKPVKKLIKPKIPDLSSYVDISDFVLKSGNLSESEAEQDGPANEVVLPQFVSGRGNIPSSKSAVRLLTEIGPRLTLKLLKIHEGLSSGEVLYHRFRAGPINPPPKKKAKLTLDNDDDDKKSNDDDMKGAGNDVKDDDDDDDMR
ncbi:hypothetical protein HELRODRAFT_100124 [Helobdella robusta]|uniref:Brix domain-containing protein n=1 Tax=Helobdella robusta TaxID=6412 RepID=T1ECY7_HELRO|nr:hypothetical protein HELRODRAFT_100124 [Helobdella robusta]ESO03352.1 hypothetical protein HELRODRAFT_100124 [Helobdella robusta]